MVSPSRQTACFAERINPDKNALPGSIAKLEFEYKRHSTQALIPSFEVGTGKIIAHHIGATRTSEDFTLLIENTVKIDSEGTWIFVVDQLNTHKSEELVKLIAEKLDIKDELKERIESFIEYYNQTMAKVFKWTYKGKLLQA